MNDKINDAIAATNTVSMVELPFELAPGRNLILNVPIDLTQDELLYWLGWLCAPVGLRKALAVVRGQVTQSGLVVTRGPVS